MPKKKVLCESGVEAEIIEFAGKDLWEISRFEGSKRILKAMNITFPVN